MASRAKEAATVWGALILLASGRRLTSNPICDVRGARAAKLVSSVGGPVEKLRQLAALQASRKGRTDVRRGHDH
jgi:hypothetical protein